jgi:hypothetical protein
MKNIFIAGFAFVYLTLASTASASSCESTCQLDLVNSYFKALDKIGKKGSSSADIDFLLNATHDDVNYVHVEYEAKFTKGSWRKAFIRNLERGAYQNNESNEIRVLSSISGKNHMAIEYSHGVIQTDGMWQKTKPLLVIFGFTDSKISLVKELW